MSTSSNFSTYSVASQAKILQMEERITKKDEQSRIRDEANRIREEKIRQENEELKRMLRDAVRPTFFHPPPPLPLSQFSANPVSTHNQPLTPSRKRHSSQQLGSKTKGSRTSGNLFEVLTQPASFEDSDCPAVGGQSAKTKSYSDVVAAPGSSTESHPVAQSTQVEHQQSSSMAPSSGLVEGLFDVRNEGGLREEIEVALEKINGNPFRGTITQLEAKHGIYAECLGFGNFDNFDGVRLGYKKCPTITFKLNSAINVDELYPLQFFEFKRKSVVNGRYVFDTISCRIRGLRPPQRTPSNTVEHSREPRMDDGTRTVTIEGCEYRVSKDALVSFLSCYGEITSDIMEVAFKDDTTANTGGTNRTGTYSCQVRLEKELPQLAPIMGKRIRFYYRGIQKLCTKCFGPHQKKQCGSRRVNWIDYVEYFVNSNENVPKEVYGRWLEYLEKHVISNSKAKWNEQSSHLISENATSTPPNEAVAPEVATAAWLGVDPGQGQKVAVENRPVAGGVLPKTTTMEANNSQSDQLKTTKADPNKPCERSFGVPIDPQEHKAMIDRLVAAGTMINEAEQIISTRKTAFNKACREYKKLQTGKQTKGIQRKQSRGSKQANQSLPINGN